MILMREKCTSSRSRDRHGLSFMNKQRMCVWARSYAGRHTMWRGLESHLRYLTGPLISSAHYHVLTSHSEGCQVVSQRWLGGTGRSLRFSVAITEFNQGSWGVVPCLLDIAHKKNPCHSSNRVGW